MKASDLFVRCLENEGITHIFGVPGEENADFMMSLEDSSIEFVLTRHEQGAAFMAGVYGRLTGNPAGCLGTLGPGAANLVTGVADANMDHGPVLALTGQGGTFRQHKESHQVMDVVGMFRPITKWAHQVIDADAIPEVIRKAVRVSRAEKMGAVLIELPEDIAKQNSDAEVVPVRRFRRPGPDRQSIETALELLAGAKRPLVICGNGAIRKRASDEVRRFAEATSIGIASTFMGKGAVDMDSPQCLFTIGLQSRDHVHCAVDASDLVLCVGYDVVEYHPWLWNEDGKKRIVHVDFEPAEIEHSYNPTVELVGDIAAAMAAVTDGLIERGVPDYELGPQKAAREAMIADFAEHKDDNGEGPIKPQKALWDLRQVLGPKDVVLSGVGAHKMWIARHYQCHEPNTCIVPNGFCSMGLPLPGAIAAKIACPGSKVVGVAGDGDFLMNVQEMETARRLGSDITLMVWEDHEYGLIAWKQHNEFHKHTDLSFGNPDWLKLGEAFGWHTQKITDAGKLRDGLRSAIDHAGPSLVVIPIDYRENLKLTERLGDIACPI